MEPTHLHYVWDYTDVDRAFWDEHLEAFVPRRIIDAHAHIADPAHRLEPMTEARRREYWVSEVSEPITAEAAERCNRIVYPGREVSLVAMGHPGLEFDVDAMNEYVRAESLRRGWHALTVLIPQWSPDRLAAELAKPGVIGVKPYYAMISRSPDTRDKHIAASIFEFLPHAHLEVLNDRRAWVTLHVPKAERLGHPDNIRQIKELRRRYPDIVLVIAHFGRCYTAPHAAEALPQLADDEGLYFDCSAVLNPATYRIAFEHIGWRRTLFGIDNPVFYMRGRRQWDGRTYVNRTSYPFHFNTQREPPEVEAGYTLMMYEIIKAIKDVCGEMGLGRDAVEGIFHDNARRLIDSVLAAKVNW
ncbi:MAG TPA: amidohydrolase family protein [Phycisphaerae bacterium]|nr:amidohydrolase family protein [Phycisphaerae bacterium]